MKKLVFIVISFMLVFTLAGCSSKETPEEVVANGLTAIKNLDLLKMQQYFDSEDINEEEDILGGGFEEQGMETLELLVKNMEYEIISSEIDEDEAVVVAKLTNIDMASIMEEYIAQAFVLAMSSIGEEENEVDEAEMQAKMEKIFTDLLARDDNEMVTNTVNIELNQVDGEWKMAFDDVLANAVFGGLMNAVDE
jgi:hypothetical protein